MLKLALTIPADRRTAALTILSIKHDYHGRHAVYRELSQATYRQANAARQAGLFDDANSLDRISSAAWAMRWGKAPAD